MKRFSVVCALLLMGSFGTAQAALLFNDTFDAEAAGLNQPLDNWTISIGTVDVLGPGFNDFLPGNGNYLDLDGSTGAAATMTANTSFTFNAGTYTLRFQLGGNRRGGDDTVVVTLGTLLNESFTLPATAGFTDIERVIPVAAFAGTGNLAFAHAGGDNVGLLLDDVSLNFASPTEPPTNGVVPEPGTLGILGLGLSALWLRQRRHKKS